MVAQTVASALEFVVSGIERLTGFLADAFAAPGLESFQALLGRIQTRIGQVVDAVSGLGGGVSDAAQRPWSLASSAYSAALPAHWWRA